MTDFPPKEDYLKELEKDIDEAVYYKYDTEEKVNEARMRLTNVEAVLKTAKSREAELRMLYFYAAGVEYFG
jgi:hypothetical protein